jgi:hypothetical protein
MTFNPKARPPGWGAGFAADGGEPVWGAEEQPGWECNKSHDHFQGVSS